MNVPDSFHSRHSKCHTRRALPTLSSLNESCFPDVCSNVYLFLCAIFELFSGFRVSLISVHYILRLFVNIVLKNAIVVLSLVIVFVD